MCRPAASGGNRTRAQGEVAAWSAFASQNLNSSESKIIILKYVVHSYGNNQSLKQSIIEKSIIKITSCMQNKYKFNEKKCLLRSLQHKGGGGDGNFGIEKNKKT